MDLGAVFPTTQIGNDPAVIRDFAQTAEGLGYRRLTTYDHVLGAVHADRDPPLPGPYTQDDAFHEPLVLFGFLAACTTAIELEAAVLVLPQRQTALVAKQAAEVDLLTGGRLVLAVGTGWNHVEYESLGMPFAARGRRLDEQVDVLRRLWREPVVDYRGEFHRIDRAGILPLPGRGAIPVWFGGGAEVALARAARSGDGFVFGSAGPRTHRRAARLHELLTEQGRDPGAFPMEAMIEYTAGPQAWADEVPAWQARGGTILSIQTMSSGTGYDRVQHRQLDSPAAHIAALGEFARVARGG
ncbi:MAG: LLM class F420-dependent oxidoreductase [Actinobacteria bacterium]|nr:LLM class F420-dependent oxidoreductase [Actinomycetota bacterium]